MFQPHRFLIPAFLTLACTAPPEEENSSSGPLPLSTPVVGEVLTVRAATSSLPPVTVEHFFLDVDRVAVEIADDDATRTIGRDVTVDLVDLVNGEQVTLGTLSPARSVTRVRLEVGCAEVHFTDGTIVERRFPLHGPAEFELSTTEFLRGPNVLVQFDADRSLLQVPTAGAMIDPEGVLVHVAVRVFDADQLTSIGGRVLDDAGTPHDLADDRPLANTSVVLEQGGLVLARSRTDGGGAYLFLGPYAGDYDVVCLPETSPPNARTIHAEAPSVNLDADFLFQLAEHDGARW